MLGELNWLAIPAFDPVKQPAPVTLFSINAGYQIVGILLVAIVVSHWR